MGGGVLPDGRGQKPNTNKNPGFCTVYDPTPRVKSGQGREVFGISRVESDQEISKSSRDGLSRSFPTQKQPWKQQVAI